MTAPDITSLRRAGLLGGVGGALTAISGVAVQAVVQPASDVSDQMWSYPWTADALVPVSIAYAVFHLLVAIGLVGFARSGVAGPGRAGRIGAAAAVGGTATLLVAELLSIPVADQRMDDTGPSLVGAVFGLGTVLSAAGLLIAGTATLRARRWAGWRRVVPLATGIWLVALAVLVMTPAIGVGVGVYGALLTALGAALYTQPLPAPAARVTPARVRA